MTAPAPTKERRRQLERIADATLKVRAAGLALNVTLNQPHPNPEMQRGVLIQLVEATAILVHRLDELEDVRARIDIEHTGIKEEARDDS